MAEQNDACEATGSASARESGDSTSARKATGSGSAPKAGGRKDVEPKTKVILAVLVAGATVMILNETILSVALPTLMKHFNASADTVQWLITGFMLTMAVVIPATGYIMERFTTRTIFLVALLSFTLGSLLGAFAPALWVLMLARIIQAIGTAISMPLLSAVAMTLVPPSRRGRVMGVISVVIAVAPALGPTLGGLILNTLGWHWMFIVMVPIGLVVFVLGFFLLTNVGENNRVPFHLPSLLLAAVAFGGMIFGLSSISKILVGANRIAIPVFLVGLVAFIAFVYFQLRLAKANRALLNLAPFTIPNYSWSIVSAVLLFMGMFGSFTILPLFLQQVLDLSPLLAGLAVMPGGVLEGIMAPYVGRLYDRYGPRPLMLPGGIIVLICYFLFSSLDQDSTLAGAITVHVIFSLGLALIMTPMMTTALGSVPKPLYGHASAILNTLQQLAGAVGTAVMVAALTLGSGAAQLQGATREAAMSSGASVAFLFAGGVATLGFISMLFVKRVPDTVEPQGTSAH